MSSGVKVVNGVAIPNLPWQERPSSDHNVVWRYDKNPVIPRDLIPDSNSIFNSAVVPYQGKFAGVFRCDDKRRNMQLYAGRSDDGITWNINHDRIRFVPKPGCDDPELIHWDYGYDPRVCWIEDRFYVTWCNGYHGPTIGVAYTYDFETFTKIENSYLPFNRNGVLFPRKINGEYVMLSRPSDNGHTPFGEIYLSHSPDMEYWGKHRWVMGTKGGWQATKIGAGPIPIETTEGWLLIYHGVLTSCNGFVYSAGAALLDIDQPWKVIARTAPYIMSPQKDYECVGDVPNVAFPCAAMADAETGRIAMYYGAADTVTGLCFAQLDELVDYIKNNSAV